MVLALTEELQRVRDEQRRLAVRAHHVEVALTRARTGMDAGVIRTTLEAVRVFVPGVSDAPVEEVAR